MRTLLLALTVAMMLAAPLAAAGVKTREITLKSGDEEIKAYLAEPEGGGTHPGIVVIQEWWGLTDWIKENARRLAEHGYVALAPDLYRGRVADNPMAARQLMQGMPRDRALRDLRAAVEALAARDDVDKEHIGSIGWCMGGGLSLQLALHEPRVRACVMCYGAVVTDPEKLQPLRATVLGIFGEQDRGIPPEAVHQFEQALKQADKKVAGIREFNAGHGFMRPANGPDQKNPVYQAEAAREAWRLIDRFFAHELQGR